MNTSFQNQLNAKEINIGLFTYITRKLWIVIVLFMLLFFSFFSFRGLDPMPAFFFSVFGGIMTFALVFLVLKQPFSPEKTAFYQLNKNTVEIQNHAGDTFYYPVNKIRSVSRRNIIILLLPNNSFAIISIRNLTSEQVHILKNIDKQA